VRIHGGRVRHTKAGWQGLSFHNLNEYDFDTVHRAILAHERHDAGFGDKIAEDAISLAERKAKRGEPVPDALVAHSRNYIEEEMAVFALQSAALPAAEVYPGSNLKAAEYLLHKTGLPAPIRSLAQRHFTRIDFDRINAVLEPLGVPAVTEQKTTLLLATPLTVSLRYKAA